MDAIEYIKTYSKKEEIEKNLKRLKQGEPVQYIVGNVDFYGYLFSVTPDVLIPRFETEELVYRTIQYIKQYHKDTGKILDIGTGSGCIAITLKKELPMSRVSAVDISSPSLAIAKKNAAYHNVDITFYEGDLFEPIFETYDLIISNPPYISYEEEIMEQVKKYEPALALYADHHGLKFYEDILKKAPCYLKEGGMIAFEIGSTQGKAVSELAKKTFPSAKIIVEKDLQNRERFVFIFTHV